MNFTKPITELIRQRFSCRTYQERPIEPQLRQRLGAYLAPPLSGPFGNPARFELVAAREGDRRALRRLGTYGFIKGATGFIVGAIRERDLCLEDYGYLMERLILYATDMGLGTCWLGGTFTKSSFARKISLRPDEIMPCVTSIGYIAERPRPLERIIRRGANADRRLPWERLFFEEEFGEALERRSAGDYAEALEMVRLGPSASNRQPWRIIRQADCYHFYLQRSPGYNERSRLQLFTVADLQRVDMGIAMCHFELTTREVGLKGRWERVKAGVVLPDETLEYTVSWVVSEGS